VAQGFPRGRDIPAPCPGAGFPVRSVGAGAGRSMGELHPERGSEGDARREIDAGEISTGGGCPRYPPCKPGCGFPDDISHARVLYIRSGGVGRQLAGCQRKMSLLSFSAVDTQEAHPYIPATDDERGAENDAEIAGKPLEELRN